MDEYSGPSPEDFALLVSVIRDVVRLQRLSTADGQDFAQTVHLKFVQRNYDAFVRFRGESSLRTYLTTVVTRALLDWRNARYGKWRPSAVAVRLGREAVRLDTLINRDGYAEETALEIARLTSGRTSASLRTIAAQLPRRSRPRVVDVELLDALPGQASPDPIETAERRQRRRRVRRALGEAYRQLPPEEQRLLSLRYRSDLSVRQISDTLQTDQKALYRRFDRVVSKLRSAIVARVPADLSASV